ncbi:hypothetical protein C8A00DRAFT_37383 [Chaetomidium leptoderma]|uniref:Uncharacterized protein n=1 Tax=Chaetomidium leptoderma TaxID=669021 RepID=A0AAN6VEJ9_9PEZI|nr:hypothetical protein C8A00DRAFT_37383 [Chaetomidium leptoderma]
MTYINLNAVTILPPYPYHLNPPAPPTVTPPPPAAHTSSPAPPRRSQGKLVSIGDYAPLSFFQTVRRLVATTVDAHAFAPETGDYIALEKVYSLKAPMGQTVPAYLDVAAGLIDLFDNSRLVE